MDPIDGQNVYKGLPNKNKYILKHVVFKDRAKITMVATSDKANFGAGVPCFGGW